MVLQLWDPYTEYRRSRSPFSRAWRGFVNQSADATSRSWSIPIDIVDESDRLIVSASLPGLSSEQIKVSVDGNTLTIKAEASAPVETSQDENQNESGFVVRERRYGSFARSIRFPKSVKADKIESRYQNGVLSVELPKTPEESPREIEVKAALPQA